MSRDWLFSDEKNVCGFRTAGVLIRDNSLLVQRDRDGSEYALPGGHVKVHETSEQSLIREFKEETGAAILCERLIWVEETFWKWGNKDAHTIAFYYLIKLADDADISDNYVEANKDNSKVILEWIPISEIGQKTVYPDFLAKKICNISSSIEHFISIEQSI